MLSRFSTWPERLQAFLSANTRRNFAYGEWDCCLFAADAIASMTGVDLAADFRGAYASRATSQLAGLRLAGSAHVAGIAVAQAEKHGMPTIRPVDAMRGDMVQVQRSYRRDSLGIVSMSGSEILIALRVGFGAISIDRAVRAWRV